MYSKSEGGLGFRQIRNLNEAMLVKQGWRLFTTHDSLVSKTYQPNITLIRISFKLSWAENQGMFGEASIKVNGSSIKVSIELVND